MAPFDLKFETSLLIISLFWQEEANFQHLKAIQQLATAANGVWSKPNVRRKTKIVCTIGPSTNTREMIWKLAETGMNVARLNMSHGDHASHQKVIDLVKEYNASHTDNVIAIMLDTKVGITSFRASTLNVKKIGSSYPWKLLSFGFNKGQKKKSLSCSIFSSYY